MKKIAAIAAIISSIGLSANAADDYSSGSAARSPVYSWTGFYAGVLVGGATGDSVISATAFGVGAGSVGYNVDGLYGGLQAGYDHQFGRFVVGAVTDISVSDIGFSASAPFPGVGTLSGGSKLTYFGTVRARAGYDFNGLLAYVHGGLAYGHFDRFLALTGFVPLNLDKTKVGYAVGAGLEYRISDRMSVQGEYSYVDFGRDTGISNAAGFATEDFDMHTFKAAVNYRF